MSLHIVEQENHTTDTDSYERALMSDGSYIYGHRGLGSNAREFDEAISRISFHPSYKKTVFKNSSFTNLPGLKKLAINTQDKPITRVR